LTTDRVWFSWDCEPYIIDTVTTDRVWLSGDCEPYITLSDNRPGLAQLGL